MKPGKREVAKRVSEKVQHDNISAIWYSMVLSERLENQWMGAKVQTAGKYGSTTLVPTAFISFGLLNVFPEIMLRKTSSISTRKPLRGWCTACKECEKRSVSHDSMKPILFSFFCQVGSGDLTKEDNRSVSHVRGPGLSWLFSGAYNDTCLHWLQPWVLLY